jgi:hypothetical protein
MFKGTRHELLNIEKNIENSIKLKLNILKKVGAPLICSFK